MTTVPPLVAPFAPVLPRAPVSPVAPVVSFPLTYRNDPRHGEQSPGLDQLPAAIFGIGGSGHRYCKDDTGLTFGSHLSAGLQGQRSTIGDETTRPRARSRYAGAHTLVLPDRAVCVRLMHENTLKSEDLCVSLTRRSQLLI